MGKTLLIGSCEPFSGKSAVALGIARQLIAVNQSICFGKPLATSVEWGGNVASLPDPCGKLLQATFLDEGLILSRNSH